MKIETTPIKTMFGKLKGHKASFGRWEADGKTKQEAKDNLIALLLDVGEITQTTKCWTFRGHVLFTWTTINKWADATSPSSETQYKIVYPNDSHKGDVVYGSSFEEHWGLIQLAQAGWSHDDEPSFVPDFLNEKQASEFLSWTRFQRLYRKAMLFGATDHEAHEMAGGNPAAKYNTAKAQAMLEGKAVVMGDAELSVFESHFPLWIHIASAHNKNQAGTKDGYVVWLRGNEPSDLKIDSLTGAASAS